MDNKNKVKTILFASLIAAMILPFSGMNTVVAEEQIKKEQKIDAKKLRDLLDAEIKATNDAIKQNKSLKNDKENQKLEKKIDRFSKMKQLVNLKEKIQDSTDDSEIERLNAKALKIIRNLQNTYDNDEVEIAKEVPKEAISLVSHTSGNDVDFYALQHRLPDCSNPNHEYAWQTGDGKAKSTGTTIEVTGTSYPSSVGTGVIGNCSIHYDDAYNTVLSGPTGTCYIFINPYYGSYDASCPTIKINQIVVVTTQATYGWYTEEYASQGWTIMSTF